MFRIRVRDMVRDMVMDRDIVQLLKVENTLSFKKKYFIRFLIGFDSPNVSENRRKKVYQN